MHLPSTGISFEPSHDSQQDMPGQYASHKDPHMDPGDQNILCMLLPMENMLLAAVPVQAL